MSIGIGLVPGLAVSKARSGAAAVQALKFAANNMRLPQASKQLTGTALSGQWRAPLYVGGQALSEVVVSMYHWQRIGETIGNGVTFSKLALEGNGTYTPITFSGARGLTLADGDTDIQSDTISASALGYASGIPAGTTLYVRARYSVTTSGHRVPNGEDISYPDCVIFDPATDSIPAVDGTGDMSANDGPNIAVGNSFCPILLGRTFDGSVMKAWCGVGDSICYGTGGFGNGSGFRRALYPDFFATGTSRATGLNFGRPSGVAGDWAGAAGARAAAYLKYGNWAFHNYGTNGPDLTASRYIFALMRTAGILKILCTGPTPRSSSSDGWTSDAGQTPAGEWSASYPNWATALQAEVGSTIDNYISCASIKGSTDSRWFLHDANTGDGLHPADYGYAYQSDDIRPTMVGYGG